MALRLVLAVLITVAGLVAQPRIFPSGAVNAASYLSPAVPGGALARGSIFSVFGESLGPRGLEARELPLPTALGGVQALIVTAGGETLLAPLLYVGANQINAILPSAVPVGLHRLRIVRDGVASNELWIKVVQASVGIFEAQEAAYGRARPAGADPLVPLHPGDAATLWATGLGPAPEGDLFPAPAGDLPARARVFVAGVEADIFYHGRAPCCVGLDQINYVVPLEASLGCFVPVWAEIGDDLVSNVVTVGIAAPGEGCEESHDGLLAPFMGELAEIELNRTFVLDAVIEEARATTLIQASRSTAAPELPLRRDDIARTPPAGSCLTPPIVTSSNPFGMAFVESIAVSGPIGQGTLAVNPAADPSWAEPPFSLGQPTHLATPESNLLLEPGPYTVESAGADGFPAFSGRLETGLPARFFNREALPALARESGLTIAYEADGRARRRILASIGTGSSSLGPEFALCSSSADATELHVPRAFLANVPSQRVSLTFSDAVYEPLELATQGAAGWIVFRRDDQVEVDLGPVHLASTPVTLPSGEIVQAELAVTASERARGLMHRPVVPPEKGMLFLFESDGVYSFWMLNTLAPLDIIWMNAEREIIFIHPDTPPCETQICPSFGPAEPSRYVLELAAGEAARRGLEVGARLDW